ncbi:NAD-dependent epimerase [bacterium]|nr:NAD-dependent epimerase [bacterium]
MKILVTGTAGFIGFHLARRLLREGWDVVGLDNVNNYYSVQLKEDRNTLLEKEDRFRLLRTNLEDGETIAALFKTEKFERVVHLAAQAGVRYSIDNPRAYIDSNQIGFFNILEGCRHNNVGHLLYASSSSVYGLNTKMPFSETDNIDHPISLYAATKKSNELTAHTYAHLFGVPSTGLRFFTVYGPWGRPDMALAKFCRAIEQGVPLQLYNGGDMERDFTYIDDIVQGITLLINQPPSANPDWDGAHPDPSSAPSPYTVYNIGAGNPVKLTTFLELIEREMGKPAIVEKLGMQPGDVKRTYSDISRIREAVGYDPKVEVEEGIANYVAWFKDYYIKQGKPLV